jgi:hypothetical protein
MLGAASTGEGVECGLHIEVKGLVPAFMNKPTFHRIVFDILFFFMVLGF